LRPGRFDRILEIPLPSKDARKEILKIHTKRKPIDNTVDLEKLSELTEMWTGADIAAMVNAAAISAIKEHLTIINENTSNSALKATTVKRIDSSTNNDDDIKNSKSNSKSKFTDKTNASIPLRISMRHFESALQKIKKRDYTKHGV
jgi:transitional endoplasmic reticulum ATPase